MDELTLTPIGRVVGRDAAIARIELDPARFPARAIAAGARVEVVVVDGGEVGVSVSHVEAVAGATVTVRGLGAAEGAFVLDLRPVRPPLAPGELYAVVEDDDVFVVELVEVHDERALALFLAAPNPGVVPDEVDPRELRPIRLHDKLEGPIEVDPAELASWDLRPVRRAVPPQHAAFAEQVAAAQGTDPLPTFANLSTETGVPVADLTHYALVRWASAGAEALMAIAPPVLAELLEAREAEDWPKVAGILDWLAAGR